MTKITTVKNYNEGCYMTNKIVMQNLRLVEELININELIND